MAWILLEGLDRSGKSSVASFYEQQGYKVVHMSAPDKKYFNPYYSGESYLEEIVRMYSKYDGQNIVFDRTVYGELIWPNVFGREALLTEEDIEYLGHMEYNNDASKILMFDPDVEAHWKRCVENKEPLTRQQFGRANIFYEKLSNKYNFIKKRLQDFQDFQEITTINSGEHMNENLQSVQEDDELLDKSNTDSSNSRISDGSAQVKTNNRLVVDQTVSGISVNSDEHNIERKLARANAIRSLLQGTIIKKKDEVYADLDMLIREFLQRELDSIFFPKPPSQELTPDEITILKVLAKRVQEKAK